MLWATEWIVGLLITWGKEVIMGTFVVVGIAAIIVGVFVASVIYYKKAA